MQQYPDPKTHLDEYVEQSKQEFVEKAREIGITPNKTIVHKWAERVFKEARKDFQKKTEEVALHNLDVIDQDYNQQLNEIKRKDMALRLKTCPPVAIVFAITGYLFYLGHETTSAFICFAMALVFLAVLVLGAIFGRPRK